MQQLLHDKICKQQISATYLLKRLHFAMRLGGALPSLTAMVCYKATSTGGRGSVGSCSDAKRCLKDEKVGLVGHKVVVNILANMDRSA
jgi:hypothetical protein